MSVTFTGLSSGIDTASLVTQLVAAERAPADAIASRQSDLTTQKSIVGSLSSALAALGTAARGMDLASELQPRTATASDAHVTVAASSGAIATMHDVHVEQLARGQITASRTFSSAAAGVLGAGSVKITTGTASATISYDGTDSLADIASRINDAGVGASASVLFDGTSYRLMVAATATGTAAAPSFLDAGDGLALSDPDNLKIAARDAIATIDGVKVTRGSNVIDDAVAGLTLTLASPHDDPDASTQVAVALDSTALTTKLKSFVTAYNAVNAALHVQLDYTGTTKGTNTLFGDATLRQLQGALGAVMSNDYGQVTLGGIGLVRDKGGGLTLDQTKLTAALARSSGAVADLFVTGGFAGAVATMTDAYTRAGDGILAGKTRALASRYDDLQSQADHINARADALKTTLEKQFTALETAISKLKSQSSYLTSAFG
ncbi:MAG TPA: flagellar filament capping protein FliD [Kofleriaceae bacterium]|nr:flagellar filament capping protein FliD [Kofleriaceae bacterium]